MDGVLLYHQTACNTSNGDANGQHDVAQRCKEIACIFDADEIGYEVADELDRR